MEARVKNSKFVLYLENKDELVKWDTFAILLKLKTIALSRFDLYLSGVIPYLKCSLGSTH